MILELTLALSRTALAALKPSLKSREFEVSFVIYELVISKSKWFSLLVLAVTVILMIVGQEEVSDWLDHGAPNLRSASNS